jgi:hypothetical protein
VQQVAVHLGPEDRVRQFHLADFLAIQIDYIHYWHVRFSLVFLAELVLLPVRFKSFQ